MMSKDDTFFTALLIIVLCTIFGACCYINDVRVGVELDAEENGR